MLSFVRESCDTAGNEFYEDQPIEETCGDFDLPYKLEPDMEECKDTAPPKSIKESTNDDKLMILVSTQNFNGSFRLEPELAELIDTTLEDIQKGI